GGWCVGSLDSHDAPCRVVAAEARATVIAIDYRLAPEHPFPAAVDDALAAFREIAAHPQRWGVDPARLAVGGDSAGGNLAAIVAHETRRDAVRPIVQWLVYPGVDMTMSHPSVESCARGFLLDKAAMQHYIATYLRDHADLRDPRASPLYAPSFAGLPRAVVATAGFDPLRDEGAAYAKALEAAGVPVVYRCYGPLIHGFLNTGGAIRAAREALSEITADLARGLRTAR
ncbi:MAG: alpha/beta hydrolase, partial [Deltaproteobacteria bacterium]|nr:alpha/beta hydrolase [Deltaproteobacteria bacterium]